jgi:hypothetical protein
MMAAAKGELSKSTGKSSEGCTCSFCGERRAGKVRGTGAQMKRQSGWDTNVNVRVWEEVPDELLPDAIMGIFTKRSCVFCILHAKVRIVGSLLKHMMRAAQSGKDTVRAWEAAVVVIVRTFCVTQKGGLKTSGKVAKQATVSALQGEQVDKILWCVRAYSKPADGRGEEETASAHLWGEVLSAVQPKEKKRLKYFETLWSHWAFMYDLLNHQDHVSDIEHSRYVQLAAEFGSTWVLAFGTDKITPYVQIIVKHRAAYLKFLGSLRPWSQEAFEAAHKRNKW